MARDTLPHFLVEHFSEPRAEIAFSRGRFLLEASETRLNEIAMKGQEMERESELVSGDGGFQTGAWKVKRFQGFESLVSVFTRHKILEISRNVIIKYFF